MNKINIAELLKDCPKGMELDCAMFENCTFEGIDDIGYTEILVKTPSGQIRLTKEGCFTHNDKYAKCVIFPKGKTTWEGFVPPCKFEDGDVIYTDNFIVILSNITEIGTVWYHCYYHIHTKRFKAKHDCGVGNINSNEFRLATKEEKEKLFQAIKDNGYKWNAETKTLEKLVEPRFKVGDKIKHKEKTRWVCTIRRVEDRYYVDGHPTCYTLPFGKQDEYELVPNKFDITTLKPFDMVLVRDNNEQLWVADLFGFHDDRMVYKFMCVGHNVNQCIPYNDDTKHLLGTTDDCDEFYKTWE